jgi:hypothetical protein
MNPGFWDKGVEIVEKICVGFFLVAALVMLFSGCELPEIQWTNVGSSGAPAFQNGWGNYGSGLQGLSYGVDNEGFLHIVGNITDSTPYTSAQAVFVLPEGCRPKTSQYTSVFGYTSGLAEINITVSILSTGNFSLGSNSGPATVYLGHLVVKMN